MEWGEIPVAPEARRPDFTLFGDQCAPLPPAPPPSPCRCSSGREALDRQEAQTFIWCSTLGKTWLSSAAKRVLGILFSFLFLARFSILPAPSGALAYGYESPSAHAQRRATPA